MSQKKVDQYKEYKANKKKILKREKVKKKLVDWLVYIIILVVGTAVLTVAVGHGMYQYKKFTHTADYNVENRVIEDLAGVLRTEAETQPLTESESETESEKETESESAKETESEKESESAKETESEKESGSAKETESEKESESAKEAE